MARIVVPVTQGTRDGAVVPAEVNGDATEGHYMANDGQTGLLVRNSGAGARTVSFVRKGTVDGAAPAVRIESIPAGETHLFSRFGTSEFGNQLDIDVEHAEVKLRALRTGN